MSGHFFYELWESMNQLIQTKMGKRKRKFFSCVCGLSDHISVLPSKFQVNPSLLRFQVVLKNLILLLYCIKNVMPCPLLLTAFFIFVSPRFSFLQSRFNLLERLLGWSTYSIRGNPPEKSNYRGGWVEARGWCYHDDHKVWGSPSLPPSLPPPTTDYQATVSVSPPAWQNRTTASPLVVTTYNTITMIAPSSHSLRVVSLCAILISKMKDLIKLCISTRTVLIRHVLICFVTSITLALIVWCINQKFRLKLKFKN